ncbi:MULTISPECIES: class I SAM-dependent methyltransferase [Pontibacillus]|uniref:Class I SAM-dependent methyltransferase n=1 Tax=Pontibacillus chungwhensis TaxID=265426 RepID=A0ABY8UYA6_9BACI|nr:MULTISPECIES: class I SAM-dependent methyltransferase [Pontibacillus]MCD5325812.1 class I SAM-dependent methyltransferase [Pontibacillus sp. HN14]WIF98345.1 class I SAM-dependent methyltransferase [Pontibacillus chungwhensis]
MGFLFSQFSKPQGLIGKAVGWLMYKQNAGINKWAMSFLDIQQDDCVLEIGFGPGYCVKELCDSYDGVRVIGLDPSEAMVEEAKRRNKKDVEGGRVRLAQGYAEESTNLHDTIDKVLAINNITYWEDPVGTLAALREQMSEKGRVAIALQPHEKGASDETTVIIGDQIRSFLEQAGFKQVLVHHKPGSPTKTTCVVGSVSDLPVQNP